jgi:hypothetical protein
MFLFHRQIQNAADHARNHPFFIRVNDADHNPTGWRGNQTSIRCVSLFFEFDCKKSQPFANPRSDRGRILANATSEYQRVQSAQRSREGADLFLDLVAKQRDRFRRPHVPRFTVEQATYIRKPFLMLLGNRFIDPVSLAIIMSIQSGLIIPS